VLQPAPRKRTVVAVDVPEALAQLPHSIEYARTAETMKDPVTLSAGTIRMLQLAAGALALVLSAGAPPAHPQNEPRFQDVLAIRDLSLEELMNMRVTSVSKKDTHLGEAPAAIAVITGDEVRRLGITTLPEALRLVPGLEVARINSHSWAISARGLAGVRQPVAPGRPDVASHAAATRRPARRGVLRRRARHGLSGGRSCNRESGTRHKI
jgi:outer membrane receptor protein involved in Fe transport